MNHDNRRDILADSIDRHVGARLRERRLDMHKTQSVMARLLGVSFEQVQMYEAGQSHLSAPALFILARALDVSPDYFYAGYVPSDAEFQDAIVGEGLDEAFARVQAPRSRRQMVVLVRSLGERQA